VLARRFQDLRVWQEALQLAACVDMVVTPLALGLRAGIADQLRRAATSVHANIAEGFGRRTARDRAHFYTIAWASLLEVEALLAELEATNPTRIVAVQSCATRARHVARLLTAFRRCVR
jgi:four helix bundle protein